MREIENCVERKADEVAYCPSIIEYNNFCEWLIDSFKKDNDRIRKDELTYLYNSFDEMGNELLDIKNSYMIAEKIEKLKKIDSINRNSFKDFLDDIKAEYDMFSELNTGGYGHYTRKISWYVLTLDYLNSAIEFLSNSKEICISCDLYPNK